MIKYMKIQFRNKLLHKIMVLVLMSTLLNCFERYCDYSSDSDVTKLSITKNYPEHCNINVNQARIILISFPFIIPTQ